MVHCLKRFAGQVLVILSGNNDYVAEEFKALLKESKSLVACAVRTMFHLALQFRLKLQLNVRTAHATVLVCGNEGCSGSEKSNYSLR